MTPISGEEQDMTDREMHRRIRALKRIEDHPERWPKIIHAAAVRKLNRVRKIAAAL